MSRFLTIFAIALLSLFLLAPGASAQRGGGFGGHGGFYGGYRGGWGLGWYGPGWGWYGPGWGYYPYWGDYYGYGTPPPRFGEVKILGAGKDAMVYVDGGYAGTVGHLKKFRLTTGSHNVELRDPSGHIFQQEKINVIPGKTLEIHGTVGGH